MHGLQDRGVEGVAEDFARERVGQPFIEDREIAEPAAEHDRIRIDDVADARKAARHAIDEPIQRRLRLAIAARGGLRDRRKTPVASGERGVFSLDRRTGDPLLEAIDVAAVAAARRFAKILLASTRQRRVAPLAADPVAAAEHPPLDDDAPADSGPEDHAEDGGEPGGGAVACLREREAVRVVLGPHRPADRGLEIGEDRLTVQADAVGVALQAGPRRDRSGKRESKVRPIARERVGRRNERRHRRDRAAVVALRRGGSLAPRDRTVAGKQGRLDLGAAEIHAEAKRSGWVDGVHFAAFGGSVGEQDAARDAENEIDPSVADVVVHRDAATDPRCYIRAMPTSPRVASSRVTRRSTRRRPVAPEDLLELVGVSDPQISPDGSRILFTRSRIEGNRTLRDLWIVDANGASDAQRLTAGGHDRHGRWSPDGNRIAFIRGGDPKIGRPQIAILDLAGGEAQLATDLPEGTLRELQWSPDGRAIAFAVRPLGEERTKAAKDARDREGASDPPRIVEDPWYRLDGDGYFLDDRFRLDWLDLASGRSRTLFDRDRIGEFSFDFAPDGRSIAITARTAKSAVLDSHKTDLLLIDVASGKARPVEGAPNGPKHAVAFSPDGKHLAIAARTGDDGLYSPRNLGLWVGPVKGRGGWRDLLDGTDWCLMASTLSDSRDASFAATLRWAPDGSRIIAKIGWHGSGRIAAVPTDGSTPRFLTEEGVELSLGNLSKDGRHAALCFGDATTPDEIAVGEITRTAILASTITDFNAPLVSSRSIAAPIEHWVESPDGTKVQVWELRPPGVAASRRTPAVVEIHGGPHAQYGLTFFHEFQCLVNAGYTVFFPNPRGSKGYGEEFCSAIRGSWGEKDWQDVAAVLAFVRSRRNVDAKRVGIMGGSYGGYMTNWAIAHDHSIPAAITDRCVSNMVSMQGNTDHYSRADRYWTGAPWDRPEALWKSSPIAYFKGVRTPTLIIHSEGDLRCNVEQGEQVHAALVAQGVPTRFVRYPASTSHGMSRSGPPDLRIHRLREILAWWKRWL